MADTESSVAHKILEANPNAYQKLVFDGATPQLAEELLGNIKPQELLATPVKAQAYADAVLAGLWLWHDGLEECHRIAQRDRPSAAETSTMAFWHAIMHRREGDFSNSKYWYARAAGHPALATIAAKAASVVNRAPADKTLLRVVNNGWNANAFVDFIESVNGDEADTRHPIAIQLQQLEWRVLWEHCVREA